MLESLIKKVAGYWLIKKRLSLRVAVPANKFKRESFVQTNLIHSHPSFSRHLYCPIKFQIFCDRTIISPYIYTPKHQTILYSQRDVAVSRICEQVEEVVWARKFVSFDSGIKYIMVISVWSYGCSKCSDTNVYVKQRMNCSGFYQKVNSGDSRICLYWYPIFGQPQSLFF